MPAPRTEAAHEVRGRSEWGGVTEKALRGVTRGRSRGTDRHGLAERKQSQWKEREEGTKWYEQDCRWRTELSPGGNRKVSSSAKKGKRDDWGLCPPCP